MSYRVSISVLLWIKNLLCGIFEDQKTILCIDNFYDIYILLIGDTPVSGIHGNEPF